MNSESRLGRIFPQQSRFSAIDIYVKKSIIQTDSHPHIEATMNEFVGLSSTLLAIWVAGYGVTLMLGQSGRYTAWTRKAFRWCSSRIWPKYRQFIFGLIAGIVLAMMYCTPRSL